MQIRIIPSQNVTGTSSEYYNCITSAAQSDPGSQTEHADLGNTRTLNIYFKKYRIDITDSVQLDMHKIYQSVQ